MDAFVIDSQEICNQYKQQRLKTSNEFIQAFFKISLGCAFIWIPISSFYEGIFITSTFMRLLFISIGFIIQQFPENSKWTYIFGFIFIIILDLRLAYLAFVKFPDFLGILSAISLHLFFHVVLEFIYNQLFGYIAICVYIVLWLFFSVYSGYIKTSPPPDILVAIVFFLFLLFIWYKHKVLKDTEEIERKIQLETKQENTQNLINAIPEGILVMSQSFKMVMSNSAYQRLLRDCEVLEFSFRNKKNESKNLEELLKKFKLGNKMTTNFGVYSNQEYFLECTGSKTEWNKQLALVITFRDVSNIIKLQKEVNLTSKTLKILQGFSHELKTPLNHLINDHEQILYTDLEIPEHIKKHLVKSLSSSSFLLSLIRDMIDYSHTKLSNLVVNLGWINPYTAIFDSICLMKNINNDWMFSFEICEEVEVFTDFYKLQQCLLSLFSICLGNLRNSVIDIKIIKGKTAVEVLISFDSVCNYSMPMDIALDYISKSLRMKTTSKVTKLICAKELKLTSNQSNIIGLSLFFEFREMENLLCIDVPCEGTINYVKEFNNSESREIIDILVVDDIETNIMILEKILENMWKNCKCNLNHRMYSVHFAKSGKEAIEKVKLLEKANGGYRIIIMDCLMPEIDGWETSIEIHKMHALKEIRILPSIIAYSAFDSKEDTTKSKESGMCGHISKPCRMQELCKEINYWIDKVTVLSSSS